MSEGTDKAAIDAEELDDLRNLLFQRELDRISWLESQVARYPTTEAVARALPEAVKMSAERSGRLKEALSQPVESALQKSVAENPQPLVDVLFPILGPMIRKAVRSALDGMLQGLNQAADHSLNPVFRFQAWRSGVPFAEYVVLRTLVYRVEQFFLLEREASLVIRHVSRDPGSEDPDMVAGMLSALGQATRQFAVDSFKVQETESLEVFQIGELQVHILMGRQAFLAAVVRGTLPQEVKVTLAEFLESVEFRYAYQLDNFQGDSEPFEALTPEMNQLLIQECLPVSTRPSRGALLILGLGILALLLAFGFHFLTEYQWNLFIKNLERQPGVLVTRTETPWKGRLGFPPLYRERQVFGIKDHLAEEPMALADDLGPLQPKVAFFWEPFQSEHPLILRR